MIMNTILVRQSVQMEHLYIGLHNGSGVQNLIAVRDTVTAVKNDELVVMDFYIKSKLS